MRIFTGGYTEPILMGSGEMVEGRCKGIACYDFDEQTGKLAYRTVTGDIQNPSYVLADAEGAYLYCVNELKDWNGIDGSTVSAFVIDRETGALQRINQQFTCGADACHLSFSPDKKYLLVSNYSGGSLAVYRIREDHGLEPATCVLRHRGRGANPERQEGPHIHQTVMAPDGQHVYVSDLGQDVFACYRADWEKGWLLPEKEKNIYGIPGQGTRHGAFDGNGTHFYVMTELTCEVNVYQYKAGQAELMQTISAFADPAQQTEGCLGAGIRIHPSGKWVYGAVRGTNHIAVFRVEADGRLTLTETKLSGGEIPREFILSPDGRYLLAANQDTDNICVFAIDEHTGGLKEVWNQENVYCVTCISF